MRTRRLSEAYEELHEYPDEALRPVDAKVGAIDPSTGPDAARRAAGLLLLRASILSEADRDEESAKAFDALIAQFATSDDQGVRAVVALAHQMRADLDLDE